MGGKKRVRERRICEEMGEEVEEKREASDGFKIDGCWIF